MKKTISLFFAILAIISLCASCSQQDPSAVYFNGKVYTQNPEQATAEAFVVDDKGVIVFVGSNEDAKKSVEKDKEYPIVDLKGRVVLPAFMDSHTHPGLIAATDSEDTEEFLLPNGSKEELFAYLEKIAQEKTDADFLMLGEWDVRLFGIKGPDRRDLDKIFPKIPVLLLDSSGHSYWLNTAALNAIGITENTPDLKENLSYFVRDENGRMTGWVKEFALFPYLTEMLSKSDDSDPVKTYYSVKKYLDFLVSKGVTTLMDGGTFDLEEPMYELLNYMDEEGDLPLRYEGTHHMYKPAHLKTAVQTILDYKKKYEGENLKFNTIKIHFDGVTEINTAAVIEPFENQPHNHGETLFDEKELTGLIMEMIPHNLNLHLHTVGDRSIRIALNAVEEAQAQYGKNLPIEVTLCHLEIVHPDDMPRFKELGVHANFTPHWFGGTVFKGGDVALGQERYKANQPANSVLKAGANVTFSSDVVIKANAKRSDPFKGIQMGVTRQESSLGRNAPIFGKESERLDVASMIQGYTINNAKQLGIENILGSIEVGKMADFLIISQDLFDMDVYDIHTVSPESVYKSGRKVYSAE